MNGAGTLCKNLHTPTSIPWRRLSFIVAQVQGRIGYLEGKITKALTGPETPLRTRWNYPTPSFRGQYEMHGREDYLYSTKNDDGPGLDLDETAAKTRAWYMNMLLDRQRTRGVVCARFQQKKKHARG